MADIYIVYTGVDREVARRLHDALEARWAVWWDEQLVGSYPQYIETEMQKAKCVVYVNSQTARDKDTIVAPAITRAFATGLCRNRTRLKWIDMRGTDHADSARDSTAETLAWIGDRFAGAPPPDDCGKF